MRDEAIAVSPFAPDFDAEERSISGMDLREWPSGSQPIPVESDTVHVRNVGSQTIHRVVAAGMSTLGYECACELVIPYNLAETRNESNRGEPCKDGCFTPFEQRKFVPEVASTWRAHLDGPHKEKK